MNKIKKDTKDIKIEANLLTSVMIKSDIVLAKKDKYKFLTYTFEPLIGPYLTIDLKDYKG